MEQWNNVELTNMSKKSYTLNHEYDAAAKLNKENTKPSANGNGTSSEQQPPAAATSEAVPDSSSDLLQPGSDVKPKVEPDDVESLLRRLYGITISEVKEIVAYDDRNFFIKEDSIFAALSGVTV
ncbi:uncharacterized protein LOC110179881 [Drosophila serrata]|uniref:uncharacterized protein LOC110179881 n=1 Tax=Drosophila serrata TaxID=7274 RepID=UPI000A1CF820|nr:uncharacterized protein LOC110179881 [Drosophila serrata]XP_020803138.1 uncharacterized protein LOC110179881 [Drosophila serrata]XP_020803139.1 uncharacterized protein LOC110179881 [Drosophila serrata]XP_020803141.1 uncharacterized protein LOC110179881 [Drosophila serrata]